ncbi:MAG TPA: hypothetical protein V6D00_06240 [Pantanalinema sp.]
MSAEEREAKQRMIAYARQSLAKDARLLDLRFEAGSSSWQASAVSKAAGVIEVVAIKENGQWSFSSSKPTKHLSRAMIGTRIENEGLGKLLVRLAVVAVIVGGAYVALPHVQAALKQLPVAGFSPPAAPAQAPLGASLNSKLLDSANGLANDPVRKAALEKASAKLTGSQGGNRGLSEINRLNSAAAGQRP